MSEQLLTEKVRVGVSACADSCPVRYNGKQFEALAVLGRERSMFEVTPVCPECMAGLGVPREPIHLTGPGEEVLAGRARVRTRHGRDVAEQVVAGARACIEALERAHVEAVIVKEGSPSCGLYHARVGRARRQSEGAGVFGAMLLQHDWFLIPDTALASPLRWWDARRRLHAWLWLKRRPLDTVPQVYDAWHALKFVVQELDRPLADAIGRDLAAMHRYDRDAAEAFRTRVLGALRRQSSPERMRQALWKAYARLRKQGALPPELCVESPEEPLGSRRIAEELLQLEKLSYQHDLLFGPSPVLARSGPYRPREGRSERAASRRR